MTGAPGASPRACGRRRSSTDAGAGTVPRRATPAGGGRRPDRRAREPSVRGERGAFGRCSASFGLRSAPVRMSFSACSAVENRPLSNRVLGVFKGLRGSIEKIRWFARSRPRTQASLAGAAGVWRLGSQARARAPGLSPGLPRRSRGDDRRAGPSVSRPSLNLVGCMRRSISPSGFLQIRIIALPPTLGKKMLRGRRRPWGGRAFEAHSTVSSPAAPSRMEVGALPIGRRGDFGDATVFAITPHANAPMRACPVKRDRRPPSEWSNCAKSGPPRRA